MLMLKAPLDAIAALASSTTRLWMNLAIAASSFMTRGPAVL